MHGWRAYLWDAACDWLYCHDQQDKKEEKETPFSAFGAFG